MRLEKRVNPAGKQDFHTLAYIVFARQQGPCYLDHAKCMEISNTWRFFDCSLRAPPEMTVGVTGAPDYISR